MPSPMDSQEPMFDSDDKPPVDQMDTGVTSTVTTVEAPQVFDPVHHHNRTLEVLEQTYVTVRKVKLSQGQTLEDDHAARVEVERAFASQRAHFEEYVRHLEGHFQTQMSIGSAQLVEVQGEAEHLRSDLRIASAGLDSGDNVIRELNEIIRRDSEVKARIDGELRQLRDILHTGKLDNSAFSSRVKELEHNISLGTSHPGDVSSGIDRLYKALLSVGDSISNNISIVSDNTKCINNPLHVVHEDTSDIRRVVNCISAHNALHAMQSPPFVSTNQEPGQETPSYPWSGSVAERLKDLRFLRT